MASLMARTGYHDRAGRREYGVAVLRVPASRTPRTAVTVTGYATGRPA